MMIYERTLSLDEADDELELIMSAARQLGLPIEVCSVQLSGGIARKVEYCYRVRIWSNLLKSNSPIGVNGCAVATQLGNAL